MSKIMLVEDDNNLREIYEARLLAEGYEIVSAHDGEEALALAVKEKPDLIISDVMMPKISGFDMLDILRSTPETKDTKVIMMTALSQAEDKDRADKLGADRYLVKSQVTLEDVAKIAREVLEGPQAAATPVPDPNPVSDVSSVVTPDPVTATAVVAAPGDPTNSGQASMPVVSEPASTVSDSTSNQVQGAQTVADESSTVASQVDQFVQQAIPVQPDPASVSTDATTLSSDNRKIVQPITNVSAKPDLNKLLEAEEKKQAMAGDPINPQTPPNPAEDPSLISL